jgi:hypothetical protein
MKKLLGLVLSIFILVPTLASAKMIRFAQEGGEETYINETAIHQLRSVKKGCEISYINRTTGMVWVIEMSCKDFVDKYKIEILNIE